MKKKNGTSLSSSTATMVTSSASDLADIQKNSSSGDFEDLLENHLGGWGPYQWRYFILFSISTLELAYVIHSPILYLYVPKTHWCAPPSELSNLTMNESLPLYSPMVFDEGDQMFRPSQCLMYDVNYEEILQLYQTGNLSTGNENWPTKSCANGWTYNLDGYFQSAATEMNWVCEDEWKISFSQSLFFAGATIGTLIFGWIADHYGRFKCVMLVHVVLLVAGILTPFTVDIHESAFFVIRFVTGLTCNTFFASFYMLALEYVSNDKRALVGNLSLAIWLTVGAYLPWLVKALGEWRSFHHILFCQSALMFLAPFFLDESVRWLIARGRIEESIHILKKIAVINKREVSEEVFHNFEANAQKMKIESELKSSYTWLDLFKTPRLRKNTILMIFTWMFTSLAFDGHVRNVSNLNTSIYVTFTVAMLLELPADLGVIWTLNNLGRRWSSVLTLVLSSFAMIACSFTLSNEMASLITAMIGRFFVTFSMNAGLQIAMEIVPTQLRGQGSGLANVVAQASSFFSSYIVYSSTVWEPMPFVLLAIVGFLGAATALFLPETAGIALPATIEEAEEFGKDQPFFYMPIFHEKSDQTKLMKNESSVSMQKV